MAETGKRDLDHPEVIDHWTVPVLALDSPNLRPGSANSGMRESRLVVIEDSDEAFEVLIRPPAPGVEFGGTLWMAVMISMPIFLLLFVWKGSPLSQFGENNWHEIVDTALKILMIGTMLWLPLSMYHMAGRWTRLRVSDGQVTVRNPNWRGKERVTQFPLTGVTKHPPGRYELAADLHLSGGDADHKLKLKNFLPQPQVNWLQAKLEQHITTAPLAAPRVQEPAHA